MMKLKLLGLFLGAFAGLASTSSTAEANGGGCATCGGANYGPRQSLFRRTPVPAFQAAPWYLYWPYNQHFMTPAPLTGAYYGPPAGGGMVNPYLPAPYSGYPAPGTAAPATAAPQAMPGTAMPAVTAPK